MDLIALSRSLRLSARKQPAPIAAKARMLAENLKILASRPDDKGLQKLIDKNLVELQRMMIGADVIPFKPH